jgi:hypothetical protein
MACQPDFCCLRWSAVLAYAPAPCTESDSACDSIAQLTHSGFVGRQSIVVGVTRFAALANALLVDRRTALTASERLQAAMAVDALLSDAGKNVESGEVGGGGVSGRRGRACLAIRIRSRYTMPKFPPEKSLHGCKRLILQRKHF